MMVGGGQLSALSGPAGEQKRLGGGVWAKPGLSTWSKVGKRTKLKSSSGHVMNHN